jgi:hypothetical protein
MIEVVEEEIVEEEEQFRKRLGDPELLYASINVFKSCVVRETIYP